MKHELKRARSALWEALRELRDIGREKGWNHELEKCQKEHGYHGSDICSSKYATQKEHGEQFVIWVDAVETVKSALELAEKIKDE